MYIPTHTPAYIHNAPAMDGLQAVTPVVEMDGVFRQSSTVAYEDPAQWIGTAIQDQENRSFIRNSGRSLVSSAANPMATLSSRLMSPRGGGRGTRYFT